MCQGQEHGRGQRLKAAQELLKAKLCETRAQHGLAKEPDH